MDDFCHAGGHPRLNASAIRGPFLLRQSGPDVKDRHTIVSVVSLFRTYVLYHMNALYMLL